MELATLLGRQVRTVSFVSCPCSTAVVQEADLTTMGKLALVATVGMDAEAAVAVPVLQVVAAVTAVLVW